jgi:hypothetical protein
VGSSGESPEFTRAPGRECNVVLRTLLTIALATPRDDPDEPEPTVSIGESADDVDEESVPSGLPPEQRRRGQTVDDDPESQETG